MELRSRLRRKKIVESSEDDQLDSKVKLTDLPELGEDWDRDVDDFLGEIKKTACIFFGEHLIDVNRDLLARMLRKARNEPK